MSLRDTSVTFRERRTCPARLCGWVEADRWAWGGGGPGPAVGVTALPEIIEAYRDAGYRFVRLDEPLRSGPGRS